MSGWRKSCIALQKGMVGSMSKDIFYQVMQGGNGVGFFRDKSKALKYIKSFNTKVELAPLKIIERQFLDDSLEDDFYDGGVNWDSWK